MSTLISPLAGKPAPASSLINVTNLVTAFHDIEPDASVAAQRVIFGTSGHRGSAFDASFNEWHVLAITQAICDYRLARDISGPLFLGLDTHALSGPACASGLEVLAANGVTVMLATNDEYTPTPAISHAILTYNHGRSSGLADGVVVTPSHNPPRDGGYKYNPPGGGPAGEDVTTAIEAAANRYLEAGLRGVKRVSHAQALAAPTTHRHDYLSAYVADLASVVDLAAIRNANIRMGVDPLGGAMQRLIALKDRFQIAFACDTDHDRHGIVTPDAGLLPPNHYLSVAVDYLFRHRPSWSAAAAVGKTVVSTRMLDLVTAGLGRRLFEVPVGFKWFAAGLLDGSLGFGGEESAGATFLRRDGTVWTTDKDGIIAALLAAEITACTGKDPGELYADLTRRLGTPVAERVQAVANAAQRKRLAALTPGSYRAAELAGEKVDSVIDQAPGDHAAIGGLRVGTASGWFAARPSGTEDIYKIYAESFQGADALERIVQSAQATVDAALASAQTPGT